MNKKNPCTDFLTDNEYLEHMIPHHQVAVDMSNMQMPLSKNDKIISLCKNIIRIQENEIFQMNSILKYPLSYFNTEKNIPHKKIITNLEKTQPNLSKAKHGDCNPLFFKPDDHMKHMHHMDKSDIGYLEHMIPHHQVAIDMSRRLLLHTKNTYLIHFCNKLIYSQEYEIFYMNSLLLSKDKLYQSNIL